MKLLIIGEMDFWNDDEEKVEHDTGIFIRASNEELRKNAELFGDEVILSRPTQANRGKTQLPDFDLLAIKFKKNVLSSVCDSNHAVSQFVDFVKQSVNNV